MGTAHRITQALKKKQKKNHRISLYFFWFGILTFVRIFIFGMLHYIVVWDWEVCLYPFWLMGMSVLETRERERRHDRLGFRGGWGFGLSVDNRLFFNVLQKSSSLGRLGPVVPTAFRLICAFSAYVRVKDTAHLHYSDFSIFITVSLWLRHCLSVREV